MCQSQASLGMLPIYPIWLWMGRNDADWGLTKEDLSCTIKSPKWVHIKHLHNPDSIGLRKGGS